MMEPLDIEEDKYTTLRLEEGLSRWIPQDVANISIYNSGDGGNYWLTYEDTKKVITWLINWREQYEQRYHDRTGNWPKEKDETV
jgi:hypothetical protein